MESDSRRGRTYYTAEDDSSSYFHERRNARDTIASKRSGVWAASPPPPSTSDSDERTTITRYDKEAMDRDSEGDERKRKKSHRKERKRKRKRKERRRDSSAESEDESAAWVEKTAIEGDILGPQPEMEVSLHDKKGLQGFGQALLPGEGEAMAKYVAEGKRIPHRGEIGLTSDEIKSFEVVGYVMSGSRHRRMEAVRIRKENQIYSADDKRALAQYNHAERSKREAKILSNFRSLIQKKTAGNK
eukprot:m.186763 g.186763  ORF g.186763 m.186763 type:complete len:244 (+) comp39354_c0_seq86:1973-2704(+)